MIYKSHMYKHIRILDVSHRITQDNRVVRDPGLRRMTHCVLRRFGCGTTLALPLGLALLGCGVLGVGFADDGAKVLP